MQLRKDVANYDESKGFEREREKAEEERQRLVPKRRFDP